MNTIIIAIIIVAIVILAFVFFSTNNKQKGNKEGENSKENKEISKSTMKKEDVFKFMEFDRIVDDMIVQNGGQRYTMAIKCKGINYDLMSEAEQMAVEQGFITFLNTLKYPIQLYVQAQNVDLKHVVKSYKDYIIPLQEEYIKQNRIFEEKSGIFDADKDEIDELIAERTKILNVYEYATDIISYVERMSVNKNLLQRNFYVIVSYSKGDISAVDKFSKDEVEELCYTELMTRCNSIISALSSSSVTGHILDSNELADLLFVAYNRDDKTVMGMRDALESEFYRLYSTSKDAFMKKKEQLQDEIETEARLKAIRSLEKALDDETYESEAKKEMNINESASKLATEMVKAENIDPDIKDSSYNNIIEEYRSNKAELEEKKEEEENELRESLEAEKVGLEEKYNVSDLKKTEDRKKEVIEEFKQEIEDEKKEIREVLLNNGIKVDESEDNEDDSII